MRRRRGRSIQNFTIVSIQLMGDNFLCKGNNLKLKLIIFT